MVIKSRKIAVIASFGRSIAIWNCIKQHLDLMSDAGAKLDIYISRAESVELIQSKYQPFVVLFSDKKDLKKKLVDSDVDLIWFPDVIATLKYGRLKKNCKIILWIQGTLPDESFLRNKSIIRKWLLELIELFAFWKADSFVFVSESMREFYKKKYRKRFANNVVVPCLSDFSDYQLKAERIPQSFVYIGGISKWQCFEETVKLYSQLKSDDSVFHIITLDVEKANQIVEDIIGKDEHITVYSIKERNKIPELLSQFQYGFLLRKQSPVNYVSSPIKFLEYLSCGVNVIMTDAVPSYAKLIKDCGIGTIIDIKDLNRVTVNPFSADAKSVYDEYFNKNIYASRYYKLIEQMSL